MSRLPVLALLFVALTACAGRHAAPEGSVDQHALVGTWYLATQGPGDRPSPGMRIALAVDSASTTAFHGRVASFFSGDVGIDPRIYQPFVGAISPADGALRLLIEPHEPNAQPLRFEGRLAGDSIAVSLLSIGRDTLRATRPLFLVRER